MARIGTQGATKGSRGETQRTVSRGIHGTVTGRKDPQTSIFGRNATTLLPSSGRPNQRWLPQPSLARVLRGGATLHLAPGRRHTGPTLASPYRC